MSKKNWKCTCKPTNPNIEIRDIHFELYLNPYIQKTYSRVYDVLINNHKRTYEAIYKEIREDTKEVAKKFEQEAYEAISTSYIDEYDDGSDYYQEIEEYIVSRVQEEFLMHYQFELMSLSNLYQVFEQQLRKWLFEEMTNRHNEYINQIEITLKSDEDYGTFYSQFGALTKVLKELNLTFTMPLEVEWSDEDLKNLFSLVEEVVEIPIVETEIWRSIRECNLISNTFKHGNGHSAKVLYKIRPELFKKIDETKLMNLYLTTNLEEVLDVDKVSFEKYANAMKDFWNKMKSHQSGSIKLEIDISSENNIEEKA
ncbi:hypothetical protein MKY88_13850 [Lysinibacillus sp. FSL R7-0073]|nr:hypothetical protein [Lysinibacillus fusiformis]MCR8853488.1 hypothetical protein [Lysinibacillus fusiformis]